MKLKRQAKLGLDFCQDELWFVFILGLQMIHFHCNTHVVNTQYVDNQSDQFGSNIASQNEMVSLPCLFEFFDIVLECCCLFNLYKYTVYSSVSIYVFVLWAQFSLHKNKPKKLQLSVFKF